MRTITVFLLIAAVVCIKQSGGKAFTSKQKENENVDYYKALNAAKANFQTACNLPGYSWAGESGYEKQLAAGALYTITANVKGEKYQTIKLTVGVPIDGPSRITGCQKLK